MWLTVGIPTVPRKREADYLTRTLETLLQELPADATDPLHARVRVLVMNNRPGNHSVFYAVSLRHLVVMSVSMLQPAHSVSALHLMHQSALSTHN